MTDSPLTEHEQKMVELFAKSFAPWAWENERFGDDHWAQENAKGVARSGGERIVLAMREAELMVCPWEATEEMKAAGASGVGPTGSDIYRAMTKEFKP